MAGKATAAAMRAAEWAHEHFCGVKGCRNYSKTEVALGIDREMGLSELADLLRRAEAHLAAEGWLEETPGAGYLLRDIRAALAKVSA